MKKIYLIYFAYLLMSIGSVSASILIQNNSIYTVEITHSGWWNTKPITTSVSSEYKKCISDRNGSKGDLITLKVKKIGDIRSETFSIKAKKSFNYIGINGDNETRISIDIEKQDRAYNNCNYGILTYF